MLYYIIFYSRKACGRGFPFSVSPKGVWGVDLCGPRLRGRRIGHVALKQPREQQSAGGPKWSKGGGRMAQRGPIWPKGEPKWPKGGAQMDQNRPPDDLKLSKMVPQPLVLFRCHISDWDGFVDGWGGSAQNLPNNFRTKSPPHLLVINIWPKPFGFVVRSGLVETNSPPDPALPYRALLQAG